VNESDIISAIRNLGATQSSLGLNFLSVASGELVKKARALFTVCEADERRGVVFAVSAAGTPASG